MNPKSKIIINKLFPFVYSSINKTEETSTSNPITTTTAATTTTTTNSTTITTTSASNYLTNTTICYAVDLEKRESLVDIDDEELLRLVTNDDTCRFSTTAGPYRNSDAFGL